MQRVQAVSAPRRNTDHVVLQGSQFTCLHCGATYEMNLPCPITVMVAAINAYTASHAGCSKPAEVHRAPTKGASKA